LRDTVRIRCREAGKNASLPKYFLKRGEGGVFVFLGFLEVGGTVDSNGDIMKRDKNKRFWGGGEEA